MKPAEALRILGLQGPSTSDEVNSAFKRHARALTIHAPEDVIEPFHTIDDLREARHILLNSAQGQNITCPTCRGSGKVQVGFKVHQCAACTGTGEKK